MYGVQSATCLHRSLHSALPGNPFPLRNSVPRIRAMRQACREASSAPIRSPPSRERKIDENLGSQRRGAARHSGLTVAQAEPRERSCALEFHAASPRISGCRPSGASVRAKRPSHRRCRALTRALLRDLSGTRSGHFRDFARAPIACTG